MIVTDFNYFEINISKVPCFSVLICWKFEYKQSLMQNDHDVKWIQLFSSHSVACPTSYFVTVEGETQLSL